MNSQPAPIQSSRKYPGCVTLCAGLLFIGAGLIALGGTLIGISYARTAWLGGLIILLIAWTVAGSCFVLAQGLWRFENWARLIVMILLGSCVSANLFISLVEPSIYQDIFGLSILPICGSMIVFAIGVYIVIWLGTHGKYFA